MKNRLCCIVITSSSKLKIIKILIFSIILFICLAGHFSKILHKDGSKPIGR